MRKQSLLLSIQIDRKLLRWANNNIIAKLLTDQHLKLVETTLSSKAKETLQTLMISKEKKRKMKCPLHNIGFTHKI